MIKLEQIKMPIDFNENMIKIACAKQLKINVNQIKSLEIIKQAIDARKKPNVIYVLNVALELEGDLEEEFTDLKFENTKKLFEYKKKTSKQSPVVVGFGPAGMFCALALARMGLNPIVIEQGKEVPEREKDVEEFWNNRKLNKHSNMQFGEGGAGTFSDGKLNTNLNNEYCKMIQNEFYHFGAPKEVLYLAKPHIGSDNLKNIVVNIRKEIISLGGKVLFSTKLIDLNIVDGTIKGIVALNLSENKEITIQSDKVVLCVGHSARDCFEMLNNKKVVMEQKPFAIGVRIEALQEDINISQYGRNYNKSLPSADYKLAVHLPNGRSVFTFCMCPGGEVVATSSNEGEVVTNGMSMFARDKKNANSAVLVNVMPSDYESSHPLAGVYFQAKYEKLAYELGGANFDAPAQTVGDFLKTNNKIKSINPTYKPGVKITEIEKCLPNFVSQSLKMGLPLLNQKLKGFASEENLLTAIETRSSCPLTIKRNVFMQSNISGLFPCGEGAGYAGGIISSAQDGIKVAEAIYNLI